MYQVFDTVEVYGKYFNILLIIFLNLLSEQLQIKWFLINLQLIVKFQQYNSKAFQ